jgi:hypothetical protein
MRSLVTRERLRAAVAPVLLVLVAFLSVAVHVPQNQALSPIDEWVYADYLDKVPTQGIVTRGEEAGQYAREELACNGARLTFPVSPELCEQTREGSEKDSDLPMGGVTSADIYTPAYFVTTWTLAQGIRLLGVDDLLDAASYAGAVWLAAGLLFMFAAMRRLGVSRTVAVALGALVVASPGAFWSSTYVSTDAPALAVGGSLLWLAVRIVQGRSGKVAFVAVSLVGTLFKSQFILGVALAGLALVAWAFEQAWAARAERGDGRVRWLLRGVASRETVTAVVALAVAAISQVVWAAIRSAIASGPYPDQAVGSPVSIRSTLSEVLKFLPDTAMDPTEAANSIALITAGTLVSWLSIAGVIGLVATTRSGEDSTWFARASMVAALAAGPVLIAGSLVVSGYAFELPFRYGLVMLPAFMACAGVLLSRQRPWLAVGLAGTAGVVYVAALFGS